MKLFSHTQRKGLILLAPLLAVIILLAAVYEIHEVRLLKDRGSELVAQLADEAKPIKQFNPNADSYEQLREAGVPAEVAVGIVRWRKYGKIYRMVEDLALVSGMNDSLYIALKPYAVIADTLAIVPKAEKAAESATQKRKSTSIKHKPIEKSRPEIMRQRFAIDTASAEYLSLWGLSPKQAEVVVNYRNASGGIFSEEHLRRCYVVDGAVADSLAKYMIYSERKPLFEQPQGDSRVSDKEPEVGAVEINSADSAALVAIDGIGPKSAQEIIKYRNLLGGYYSVEQIAELKCIIDENFVKFLPKISCDSCKISKIDINFATPKELVRHPYISTLALRRIIKQRQLKGGWRRIEEMTEQNIFSEEEAKRLAPYLRFGPSATE